MKTLFISLYAALSLTAIYAVAAESVFKGQRVVEAAAEIAREHAGAGATVEFTGLVQDIRVAEDVQAELRVARGNGAHAVNVIVDFRNGDGRVVRQITLPFSVKRAQKVAVATRVLRTGEVVRAEDIRLEDRSALGINNAEDPSMVVGRTVRGVVRPGDIIRSETLAPLSGVVRGGTVTVLAGNGGVTIRATGKVLADAKAGEKVAVVREGSKAPLQCVVIDEQTVAIIEE